MSYIQYVVERGPHAFHVSCDSKERYEPKIKHILIIRLFIYAWNNGQRDKSRRDHTEDQLHDRYQKLKFHEVAYKQKGGIYMYRDMTS